MSTATDFITSALSRLKAGSTQVEFIHKPHTYWPHPRPNPHSPPGPGSPITTTAVSDLPVAVLDSSFNPPTLAHRALASLPAASSPTGARLLLLSVRNADKVPHPGDASPVQRVEMMVHLAHEVNAAVGLVDAPAFVLEVTSPGVDRPLTTEKHYRRARGRKVELTLSDGSQLTGRLGEIRDGTVRLVVREGARPNFSIRDLPIDGIAKAVVQVEFSPPNQRELELAGQSGKEASA